MNNYDYKIIVNTVIVNNIHINNSDESYFNFTEHEYKFKI